MQQKNPYYLHEENQMNVINTSHNQPQNYNSSNPIIPNTYNVQRNQRQHEQFARQNSTNNNPFNQPFAQRIPVQYPAIISQPPAFQSFSHQYQPLSYQPPSFPGYQNRPLYSPINQGPYERQYNQSSHSSGSNRFTYDHCPFCNKMTNSIVQEKPIFIAWIICFILFCFTVLLFWLPFCFDSCKQRRYKCVECKRVKFVIKNSC